jgi:integrase
MPCRCAWLLRACFTHHRSDRCPAHNADIAQVQKWLGHTNIATTRLYDRRQSQQKRAQRLKCNINGL